MLTTLKLCWFAGSVIVYFLCMTEDAHYKLRQMIMSDFMRAVFATTIASLARTRRKAVDVYVRAMNSTSNSYASPLHKTKVSQVTYYYYFKQAVKGILKKTRT